jgi:phage RecT family recombinase
MTAPARAVTSRTVEPSAPSLIDQVIARTLETQDARKRISPVLRSGETFNWLTAAVREEFIKTPKLLECTDESITAAVVKIQRWGLEIGDTAYLVPFRDTRNDRWVCTAVRSYIGDIQLLIGNGVARRVDAKCVYKNEVFHYEEGLNPRLEHHPLAPSQRGEMIGAWATVWLTYTHAKSTFLFLEEIDSVRKEKSVQWKSGPCPDWWACKRAIKVVTKLLPKSQRLNAVLAAMKDEDDSIADAVGSTQRALESVRPAHITSDGEDRTDAPPVRGADEPTNGNGHAPVMRFGRTKGKPLSELEMRELESARKWANETDADKFAEAIEELDGELERRRFSQANTQGSLPIDGGPAPTRNAIAQALNGYAVGV